MKRLGCAAVLLVLGLTAAPALAQQPPQPPAPGQRQQLRQQRRHRLQQRLQQRFDRRFQTLDANNDGAIGRDEWKRRPEAFDRIDTNHDNMLSRDELRSATRRAMRRARRR